MTWLPFLQDEGYLPTDPSTGYLRQMPLALQHTISTAMLEHLSSDAARVIKATVRSQSDLMYLMETIGVAFGFSTSEYAASVKKAMDVYLLLFTPPLATQLRLFEDQSIKEACLLHALKQLSLGLEVRHDFPAGTIPHVQLIARLMDHISKIMTAQERSLSSGTWSSIVTICLGMLDYVCSAQAGKLPSEIRLTVASAAFEALVRSRTRDAVVWDRFAARVPNTYAATAQWAVAVVAVTRAVAAISARRALPPCIPIAWRGVVRPTRNVTNWIDYTQDELVFLWKNLCVLINPLRLKHVDSLNVAAEALRDSTMVLASATYWPRSMLPGGCDDPNADLDVCSSLIPLGISTSAILRVWGDALLHLCIGSSSKLMQHPMADLDESRARAVEGLCFAMLRRETELHCPLEYWQCFVKMMEDVCDGTSDRLRGVLLLHVTPLFALDLPWPYHVVRKLNLFACEVLGELADSAATAANAMLDEDDEDGVSARPAAQGIDDDNDMGGGLGRAATIQEAAEMQQAAIIVVTNAAVHAHMHRDVSAVVGAMTALQSAAERFQPIAEVCQRSLCALTHVLQHIMGHVKDTPTVDAAEVNWGQYDAAVMSGLLDHVISDSLAMLSAPCGTFHSQSLVVVIRFVGWNAYLLPESTLAAALGKVTLFCAEACRVLDQASTSTDVETLSSLFCVAAEVVGALLQCPRTCLLIKNNPDHLHNISKRIDVGFAAIRTQTLPRFQVREASYQLLRHLEVAWWWPSCDNCSATSAGVSEQHLKGLCSSMQVFALGCSRIVTIAQVDHQAVSRAGAAASWLGDSDVVMIVRSRGGRRVWMVRRNIDLRERPDVEQLGSPKAMPAANESFPVSSFSLDGDEAATSSDNNLLKEVDEQPRTKALLEAWLANPDIQQLLSEFEGANTPYSMDSNLRATSTDLGVVDVVQQHVVVARHLIHDLGFPYARFKPLTVDAKTIGVLKGLDLLEERHTTNVDVVYVDEDAADETKHAAECSGAGLDSRDAFTEFCGAFGWMVSDEVGESAASQLAKQHRADDASRRVHATMRDVLHVTCKTLPISGIPTTPANGRARVLWDSTSTRYDWTAMSHSPHRLLYTSVCPSLRRSAHPGNTLAIVVRPLVQQGLYVIQLIWPDAVADRDVSPAMWGGPLLHNTVVTASALPSLLREAVVYGVDRLYTDPTAAPNPRAISLQNFLHDRPPCTPAQALSHVLLPQ